MKKWILGAILLLIVTAAGLKIYAAKTEAELTRQVKQEEALRDKKREERLKKEAAKKKAAEVKKEAPAPAESPVEEAPAANAVPGEGPLIAIDAGHQAHGNPDQETIAPSSGKTKAKVADGTRGVATGIAEYEFNLNFSQCLKRKLESAGYRVFMIRESNDVNISNQERAAMANASGAQVYLRIHANGGPASAKGIETYYPSKNNPDVGHLSDSSRQLSELILSEMCASTGAKGRGAIARDDLTGTNFAQMPTSLIECGYMSNAEEDKKLNDPSYQEAMALGILRALDRYFQR
ncbi:MAG: N-acetylmuramoyl-L-alanine amidase family protein [Aedoeadaptatus pacaensis]